MATVRQVEANRRNSLFSTGARTLAGSMASSQNARTHGMAAEDGTNPGEKILIEDTRQEWIDELKIPRGARQWAAAERWMAAEARLEWCRLIEDAWRYRQARRAALNWDEDCRLERWKLAAKLAKDVPVLTVAKLRQTLQGCVWLEQQFRLLADLLARQAGAEPGGEPATALPGLEGDDRSRALDLLGLSAQEAAFGPPRLDRRRGACSAPARTGAHAPAGGGDREPGDPPGGCRIRPQRARPGGGEAGAGSRCRLDTPSDPPLRERPRIAGRIEATAEMKQLKADAETADMEPPVRPISANRGRRPSEPAEVPPTPRSRGKKSPGPRRRRWR